MLDHEIGPIILWVALGMVCGGLTVWFFMKHLMLRKLIKHPTSHIGMVEDVTERMEAQEKARSSQLRTTSLINTIDGIVWEAKPLLLKV